MFEIIASKIFLKHLQATIFLVSKPSIYGLYERYSQFGRHLSLVVNKAAVQGSKTPGLLFCLGSVMQPSATAAPPCLATAVSSVS